MAIMEPDWEKPLDPKNMAFYPRGAISSPEVDLADAHWRYTEKMMHIAYVEAFQHGYKHGAESVKDRR